MLTELWWDRKEHLFTYLVLQSKKLIITITLATLQQRQDAIQLFALSRFDRLQLRLETRLQLSELLVDVPTNGHRFGTTSRRSNAAAGVTRRPGGRAALRVRIVVDHVLAAKHSIAHRGHDEGLAAGRRFGQLPVVELAVEHGPVQGAVAGQQSQRVCVAFDEQVHSVQAERFPGVCYEPEHEFGDSGVFKLDIESVQLRVVGLEDELALVGLVVLLGASHVQLQLGTFGNERESRHLVNRTYGNGLLAEHGLGGIVRSGQDYAAIWIE